MDETADGYGVSHSKICRHSHAHNMSLITIISRVLSPRILSLAWAEPHGQQFRHGAAPKLLAC